MRDENIKMVDEEFGLGTLYFVTILDDKYHLSFRLDKDNSMGEHTHFFLQKEVGKEEDFGIPVDEAFKIYYIFREQEIPPVEGLTDVVLQIGFSYETKKEWNNIFIEFLSTRKLDQQLLDEMACWIEISLENLDDITVIDEETGEIIIE